MALLLLSLAPAAHSHATLTLPIPRTGGDLAQRPSSQKSIKWYTSGVTIPGERVIPDELITERRFGCKGHPWKAPGTAPVWGPCGAWCNGCHDGAAPRSKPEDDARNLPPKQRVKWQAGSTTEVAWGMNTNHGGGYSYRLCPASSELTEECFQHYPLDFIGNTTWAQFGDDRSSRQAITAVRTRLGVNGSMWSRNPIANCNGKDWKCPFDAPIKGHWWGNADGETMGKINLVDLIRVPSLPPGNYVLGWRWDTESTAQVWQNCADVTITDSPPKPTPPPTPGPAPTPGPKCTFNKGYDCAGNDMNHQFVDTPEECCDLCGQTSGCTAFTHKAQAGKKGAVCYMKKACPSKAPKDKCTAGVLNELSGHRWQWV